MIYPGDEVETIVKNMSRDRGGLGGGRALKGEADHTVTTVRYAPPTESWFKLK